MQWLKRRPFICSSPNSLYLRHYYHHLFSLVKNSPLSSSLSAPLALQIHSQLTASGCLKQPSNTQIIFLFNTLLRHYALSPFPLRAFSLYKQAQNLSLYFDTFTYSFLIKASANLGFGFLGTQFHCLVFKLGFGREVYVQTALLNMYVNFGFVGGAHKVFDEMPERNLVTWNVMLTGLVKWGHLDRAVSLFWEMPGRNIVSWTGIIDGCTRMKNHVLAYSMFRKMIMDGGIMPSKVTLLAISPAVSDLGDIKNCQSIHAYVYKTGLNSADIQIMNNLTDTYAKCGCISRALAVFEEIPLNRRDLVSWTSIISAFAMHGMAKEAAESLDRMEGLGFAPNRITVLGILNAYSHSGLVEEGVQFFRRITNNCQFEPDTKHYGCVIDMLGRAGKLKEAEEIAREIPDNVDNIVIWRTLLGACSVHGNAEMAERVTKKIHEMEMGYGGDYVLMSNILTGTGKYGEAENFRTLMDERSVPKIPAHCVV